MDNEKLIKSYVDALSAEVSNKTLEVCTLRAQLQVALENVNELKKQLEEKEKPAEVSPAA